MAADFIKIDRNKIHGNRVVMMSDKLVELRATIISEYDSGTHMFDGDDYSKLEENFGIEAGAGANFLFLLGLLREILVGEGDVPGPARKAQLDEFCARIGGQ